MFVELQAVQIFGSLSQTNASNLEKKDTSRKTTTLARQRHTFP